MSRVSALLSKPLGLFAALTAYTLIAAILLCAIDSIELPVDESPLFFTVSLGLFYYPLLFLVTGAAAGKFQIWPMPLVTLAVLIGVSCCYGGGIFSPTYYGGWSTFLQASLFFIIPYLAVSYASLFISRLLIWKRSNAPHPRARAVLCTLGLSIPAYGAIHIPGYCWSHPFWGEMLWYLFHLALAVLVGAYSGLDIRHLFLMPFVTFFITILSEGPPVFHFTARIPMDLAKMWNIVCFVICWVCMFAAFLIKQKLNKKKNESSNEPS